MESGKEKKTVARGLFSDEFMRKIYVMFPEGRNKTFTLSYDDGNTCDEPLVRMMRQYGVKGTFNINSLVNPFDGEATEERPWRAMTLTECVDLYGEDMEIAIHGARHPHWNRLSTSQAMADILDDRRNLEKATGKIIRGAAYPYGAYNDAVVEILALMDIQYCRTVESSGSTNMKKDPDWLRLKPTCHHNDPKLMTIAAKFLKTNSNILQMFYVWGHTHEFVLEDNWQIMEDLLKAVGNREDVWYATNIEIVEYLKASKRLIYNIDQTIVRNPTDLDVWLKITPRNQIIKVPAGQTVALPE